MGATSGCGLSPDIAWSDHRIRFFTKLVTGKRVLDIGCVEHDREKFKSPYWVHRALTQAAKSVVGLDYDEAGVAFLRENGFNVLIGDACDFDLGETFDVIVAGDVIEHLDNTGGFLKSCRRHLSPGGMLLVTTPNPWYWRHIAKAVVRGRVQSNVEHVCWIDPVLLGQLAARHGFALREDEVEYGTREWFNRILPLPTMVKHSTYHAILRPA
ncbi:class I SAM-dependent methyltransferase [Azospirillum soli]|uniref:class I SAM-dependent methyltransferase n=1 Tax=Azospirillum soli TaxID=1304799 RepID=UPI001AE653F6|nr:class I SAM-dependent methyltransferase [Azospirillum soli]MBP2316396.1 SAM-dependent methyltransferase [Azospirillum soli]